MTSKQDKPADDPRPAESKRELLGLMRGSELFDENGELDEEKLNVFAEQLSDALRAKKD